MDSLPRSPGEPWLSTFEDGVVFGCLLWRELRSILVRVSPFAFGCGSGAADLAAFCS
ncbi:unnamed protein product [Arabidopsis halleri]